MTWEEFKNHIESQGVNNEDYITMIDWQDYNNNPTVVILVKGHGYDKRLKKLVENKTFKILEDIETAKKNIQELHVDFMNPHLTKILN